jgi:hypothetical protein
VSQQKPVPFGPVPSQRETHAAHQVLQVRSERRGSNRGSTFNVSGSKISLTVGLFQQIEYLVPLAKLAVAKTIGFRADALRREADAAK